MLCQQLNVLDMEGDCADDGETAAIHNANGQKASGVYVDMDQGEDEDANQVDDEETEDDQCRLGFQLYL